MYPPLNRLRMQNIFNPQLDEPSVMPLSPPMQGNMSPQLGPQTMGPMPQPSPEGYDPAARMKELYTPETGASDRFNTMIDNPPQYNEHQGKLRSLAAAIVAATQGSQAGTNALMAPYNHELAQYKQKIGPAGQAATLEKSNNANERTLATQTVNQELTNKRDDARNVNNERSAKVREDRAAVYRFKTEHPNKKFDFSGPKVLIADPATGEIINTGIETGSLSDADKLDLQHKNRTAEIETTGGETRKTEETRQDNRKELIPLEGDEARKTKAAPSALTNKGEIPTQTKAAHQFALKNPTLAKWIKLGKSNTYDIVKPAVKSNDWRDTFRGVGPTEAEYKRITDAIYGEALPVEQPKRTGDTSTSTTTPNTNTPANKPNIPGLPPEGKIKVSNDGGKTKHWLPFKQFETAKKQGYVQVQ